MQTISQGQTGGKETKTKKTMRNHAFNAFNAALQTNHHLRNSPVIAQPEKEKSGKGRSIKQNPEKAEVYKYKR